MAFNVITLVVHATFVCSVNTVAVHRIKRMIRKILLFGASRIKLMVPLWELCEGSHFTCYAFAYFVNSFINSLIHPCRLSAELRRNIFAILIASKLVRMLGKDFLQKAEFRMNSPITEFVSNVYNIHSKYLHGDCCP